MNNVQRLYINSLSEEQKLSPIVSTKVYIDKSKIHGYGCFASEDIERFELIENTLCDAVDPNDKAIADKRFSYPSRDDCMAYVLPRGNAVTYNHSEEPNADWVFVSPGLFSFYALRKIKKGEEIFTFYGKEWWEQRKLSMNRGI